MSTTHEHTWFAEQIATYLADGLDGDERARFEEHAATCDECAAELDRARADERRLAELFEDAAPAPGFEDRMIARLRSAGGRRVWIHPLVVRVAATAAAVALVGGVGYVASDFVRPGTASVTTASALRQAGQAVLVDSSDGKDLPALRAERAPNSNAEKWDFGGGSDTALNWSNWDEKAGVQRGLSYSYANPDPDGRDRRAGDSNNHDEDRSNVVRDKRYVEFQKNPFSGVQRDNIYAGRAISGSAAEGLSTQTLAGKPVRAMAGPTGGLNGAVMGETERFKPQQFSLGQPAITNETVLGVQVRKEVLGREVQAVEPAGPATAAPPLAAEPPPEPTTTVSVQRKVIRNGQLEFEVDSFDSAVATITKVVAEESGFVATTSSAKLDNGKVKGTIVVRVPPDRLDTLVLKLRALGDLKRQNLSAQDVTKHYTDLESELRAARAMEERLIEIIKTGKGEIKDLLAAEKELATWRGKIEKILGEINYYNNQIALSTLSIDLTERNISSAAAATEREDVSAGVETEDVEAARAEALRSIDEAKGRIIESELKKLDAGQLAAKIVAEVPPQNAGPVIDRLKQLGKVARLDIQRKQTTPDGATPAPNARVEQKETRLIISLYNLANVAPRETTNLNLACTEVEGAYRTLLARVEKAGGRVVSSALNRAKADQITGTIHFEVKGAEAGPVLLDARSQGEVLRLAVTENPDTANVTTAKHGFMVQLFSAAQIAPRETVTLRIAATDVPEAYKSLLDAAKEHGRVLSSQVDENDRQNVTGTLDLEIPRERRDALEQAIGSSGDVVSRNAVRSSDTENTIDSKLRMQISLIAADQVPPRESTQIGVQTSNVDSAVAKITSAATAAGGRVVESSVSRDGDGRNTARMLLDVPLGKAAAVLDQVKSTGEVRTERSAKNAQVPEGTLSRARIEVALGTPQAIVSPDKSLWGSIRDGLGASIAGLMWSLQILVIGLCFVVPWALLLWGTWKLIQRVRRVTA